jgi:predicted amidophosphoribosyltransferase
MFCPACGQPVANNAQFCEHCGTRLQNTTNDDPYEAFGGAESRPASLSQPSTMRQARNTRGASAAKDPYKEQIADIKLQIKQLKLDLKQITTNMSTTRSQYYETSTFVPRGLLRHGYKMIEDFRLLGPQQQKQRLQAEIAQLEQQLLGLQQAQLSWKRGQQG